MKVIDKILDSLGGERFKIPLKVQNEKINHLYYKAKRDQWNLDDKNFFPKEFNGDINEWLGITDEVRLAAARSFSSFYYGEQGAKLISAQLATMARTPEASKFLATQTMDEARHVEVFEGMLNFIDEIHPMNPFLNAFLSDIYRAPSMAEKLVGMNLLVEGLALSAFRATISSLKSGINISEQGYKAVGAPIEAIIRDESRHVGFGVLYLPDVLKGLSRSQKTKLRLRQLVWLGLLYGSVKYHQKDQELMGIDYIELLNGLISDHERRIQECGGDALISTEGMKSLIPNVDKLVDYAIKYK